MSRTAIVVALVATFLIGASLGLMGGILFSMSQRPPRALWVERAPSMRGAGRSPAMEGRLPRHLRVLPRLRKALDLTDAQVARVESLVVQTHASMETSRDSLRARIERVLTPAQRERWRRLEAEHRFPGESRGRSGRAYRALPGDEGVER